MKSRSPSIQFTSALLASVFLALLAGCASTPKIDWNSRIGNYTYDQAVLELGPPDRDARLGNGSIVAEWLTQRGYRHGYVSSFYGYDYGSPYFYPAPAYHYVDPPSPDYFVRLTFGTDQKLIAWKHVRR